MTAPTAVLVMAYGTPAGLDEVEAYYTDIRHGRPPPPDLLDELKERYRAIGGRSPLLDITRAQAAGIAERVGAPAYVGQKHAPPFIRDAVAEIAAAGVERAVGLVMAPHYSSMSIGDYARRAARAGDEVGWKGKIEMIESWHLEPGYVDWLAQAIGEALETLGEASDVLFTAHSLPARIVQRQDPYPEQLAETAGAVAERMSLPSWRLAWQSAGRTGDPWLGPDVTEVLAELGERGTTGVVVCPCGFVADHLEVLYDIDIEARRVAEELGMRLVRTRSPNDDPSFLDVLAALVQRVL